MAFSTRQIKLTLLGLFSILILVWFAAGTLSETAGKTYEGLAGGLIASAVAAAIATLWFFPELPYQWSIPVALVLAAVGVLGDLAESALKRGAGTKDAASILPGHGGFLDRLDSLLFGAPILYYFARFYF